MIIIKIALGLLGLGIVVFIHELGHFLGAKLVGIKVEAFSLGWGKSILKKKIKNVEYRLGMFPVGGYCKMAGENDYEKVWEDSKNNIKQEKCTFLGASPWRRIIVSFMGPFFNFLFAVIILSIVWGIGFEEQVMENRIILASDIEPDTIYPADRANLISGDRIIEINGNKTDFHNDIQKIIVLNPEKEIVIKIVRDGEEKLLTVTPELDKNSGAGKIGVYFWTDPVIAEIIPDSFAAKAGLEPNDKIIRINNVNVDNTVKFGNELKNILEGQIITVPLDFIRNGEEYSTELQIPMQAGDEFGIKWSYIKYRTPSLSVPAAFVQGVKTSWETLEYSVKGLGLLFRGVNLTKAVSGPVRITYMVGEIAAEGFGQSFGTGLRDMARFLALISIALCVMNLLPLPILDGGLIILFIAEMIRRKPAHPRAIKIFQMTGIFIIGALMLFALFGDILFFTQP